MKRRKTGTRELIEMRGAHIAQKLRKKHKLPDTLIAFRTDEGDMIAFKQTELHVLNVQPGEIVGVYTLKEVKQVRIETTLEDP